MRIVIDASVAVKWFLLHRSSEQNLVQARRLAERVGHPSTALFAPPHWQMETLSVLVRLEPQLAGEALGVLNDMSARIVSGSTSMQLGLRIAADLRHHLFDTLYHAVAMEMEAMLVTADEAYFDKAKPLGSIMRLADFPT